MTEYLTIKEVASRMKVGTRTVANWLKRGLPHIKLGGLVRVVPADLDKWILLHSRNALLPSIPELVVELRGARKKESQALKKCQQRKATSSLL